MKALFTIILSTLLAVTANANNIDGVTIAPKAKTTSIEVKLTATLATEATIVVKNEVGKVVNTKAVKLVAGTNAVNLLDVETLAEGTFVVTITAGTEVSTTSFINLKTL